MWWWWLGAAFAGTCPEVGPLTSEAWVAFDDAELERATRSLETAVSGLTCASAPIPIEQQLELRWLEALIALGRGDRAAAHDAMQAALRIDPLRRPPAKYGPQLGELYSATEATLSPQRYVVSVQNAGTEVWLDGRRVLPGAPLQVVPGRHLMQWPENGGFHSEWTDVFTDFPIAIGAAPAKPERPPREKSAGGSWTLAVGGVLTGAGLGLVGVAWVSENQFLDAPYDATEYGGCLRGTNCYADARLDQIAADAFRVRAMYAAGYALSTVGVAAIGTHWILGVTTAADGGGLRLSGRW